MKKILFLLLPLFALSACKEEFLESTPYGQSVSSTFWRNAADALAGANAMYEPLRNEEFYGHSEQTFEICGDDFWRAGDHGEDQAIEDFTFDASNAQLGHSYNSKYEIVNRANAVSPPAQDESFGRTEEPDPTKPTGPRHDRRSGRRAIQRHR